MSVLQQSDGFDNYMFSIIVYFTRLIRDHFSAFFAPVCLNNNMLLFKVSANAFTKVSQTCEITAAQLDELYSLCQLKVSCSEYCRYLTELINGILCKSSLEEVT